MNERIKQLADASGASTVLFDMNGHYTVMSPELKKFAELLIDECYTIINVIPGEHVFADKAYDKGYFDGRKDAASMLIDFF